MNIKRTAIAVVVIVIAQGIFFAILPPLFPAQYGALFERFRTDLQTPPYIVAIMLGYLVTVILACFIFIKGYENKGLAEGARFGLVIGALLASAEWFHAIMFPLPLYFAVLTVVDTVIVWIISGLILAVICKPEES